MATVICSLGHGLRLTAVPRSTPPCIPSMSLDRVSASAGGKGHNCQTAGVHRIKQCLGLAIRKLILHATGRRLCGDVWTLLKH